MDRFENMTIRRVVWPEIEFGKAWDERNQESEMTKIEDLLDLETTSDMLMTISK